MKEFVLGRSQAIQELMNRAKAVADSDIPVLLQGETGTGKNRMAEHIHFHSKRRNGLFLRMDCAEFSRTLIESELFGHEKGAFTGATEKKAGLLELVCGGTLFLDEVENLDHELQIKLLHVIENKEFRRVGGRESIKTDFRVISATNVDIEQLIRSGVFRKDFYYRLKGIEFNLPPLRERQEDIRHFVEYFLEAFGKRYKKHLTISQETMLYLEAYLWPGNVREVMRVLETLVVTSEGDVISPKKLPLEILTGDIAQRKKGGKILTLKELEKEHILRVYKETGHNKVRTARLLGITVNTLKAKIRSYSL